MYLPISIMMGIEFESSHNLIGGTIQKHAWNEQEKITKGKESSVKVRCLKDRILSQDPCIQRSAMDPTVTFCQSHKVQLQKTDKLTSTTSVLAYLIQTPPVWMYTWITNTGLGGRPWPSHKRLSHANEISQRGSSDGSDTDRDNGTEGNYFCQL
jgi:hypothetical protein